MSEHIKKAEKGEKTAYLRIGAWYNESTGHIHLTLPGSGGFHTTVNNDVDSKRCHRNLFAKLARALNEAGVPAPDVEKD